MLTIEYNPDEGLTLPDGKIAAFPKLYTNNFTEMEGRLIVANENIVNAFRADIAEGKCSPDKIQFAFKNEILSVNKDAVLKPFPREFCYLGLSFSSRILKAWAERGKQK